MTLSRSKKLSTLLRGITSKHHGEFFCINYHHSFAAENKREFHKKVCKNKDFFNIVMSSGDTKILEFNQNQKSDQALFIIYADLECLIEKIHRCKNNPETLFTLKLGEHIPSDFRFFKPTISSFKNIENKHDVYRGKDKKS